MLQNLKVDAPALVRRWRALPPEVERQVREAGGTLVDGRDLIGFARRCWGADLVIGGGQLVRDNQSPRSLAGLLLAAISARAGGGRVLTRGLGVSRVSTRPARFFWSRILRRADQVRVRDRRSADHAARLVAKGKVLETADMVFLSFDPSRAGPQAGEHRDAVIVAPCVDAGENRFLPPELVDDLTRAALSTVPDARLVLACHDPQPEMDLAAARAIAARLPEVQASILAGYDLSTLEQAYRSAALVITNRLHSVIFSLLNGAPVIIIDDGNPKLRAVAATFDLPLMDNATAAEVPGIVAGALAVDYAARRALLSDLHARAQANVTS
ncbi:polysaccharide pyruvyl transferase family protein [Sphingomonas aracearum]|uniref:polysaccharide pyruvyl transferase family protein n=1 Tax=Sphingomonas aracearum TaxID=2283317 RepID=UPI0015EFE2DA|nr:polysaccharide pyruvyl transferase family protein [Sphingomonas aracearum]